MYANGGGAAVFKGLLVVEWIALSVVMRGMVEFARIGKAGPWWWCGLMNVLFFLDLSSRYWTTVTQFQLAQQTGSLAAGGGSYV